MYKRQLGLHPCDVKTCFKGDTRYRSQGWEDYQLTCHTYEELFDFFEGLYQKNTDKIVGFGETGFDLYHENTPEIFKKQTEVFHHHLKLAQKYEKPIVIHGRNAEQQILDAFEANFKPSPQAHF